MQDGSGGWRRKISRRMSPLFGGAPTVAATVAAPRRRPWRVVSSPSSVILVCTELESPLASFGWLPTCRLLPDESPCAWLQTTRYIGLAPRLNLMQSDYFFSCIEHACRNYTQTASMHPPLIFLKINIKFIFHVTLQSRNLLVFCSHTYDNKYLLVVNICLPLYLSGRGRAHGANALMLITPGVKSAPSTPTTTEVFVTLRQASCGITPFLCRTTCSPTFTLCRHQKET